MSSRGRGLSIESRDVVNNISSGGACWQPSGVTTTLAWPSRPRCTDASPPRLGTSDRSMPCSRPPAHTQRPRRPHSRAVLVGSWGRRERAARRGCACLFGTSCSSRPSPSLGAPSSAASRHTPTPCHRRHRCRHSLHHFRCHRHRCHRHHHPLRRRHRFHHRRRQRRLRRRICR